MRRKIYAIGLFLIISLATHGQEVIATKGGRLTNTSATMDFTIGEVVIESLNGNSTVMTQGFLQSNITIIATAISSFQYDISVFPNPTSDVLVIETPGNSGVTYQLIDINGDVLSTNIITGESLKLDIQKHESGMYLLRLTHQNGEEHEVYQIIKQ
jgi:hypothetical protein